ncbi:hypothetical protein BCEN4_910032 [Burkholderia cenocepacia]|nr:hypothetical protein BCEN4_910032 [Burkholderia cenocepacia]
MRKNEFTEKVTDYKHSGTLQLSTEVDKTPNKVTERLSVPQIGNDPRFQELATRQAGGL